METIENEYLNILCIEFCTTQEIEYLQKFSFIFQKSPRMEQHLRNRFLHIASQFQNVKMIQFLLEEGVNPDHQCCDGSTALHHCAGANWRDLGDTNKKCIDLLLEFGANISLSNAKGETALHVAVGNENCVAIQLLLEDGVDILKENNDGHTAYNIAQHLQHKLDRTTFQNILKYVVGDSHVDSLGATYLHKAIANNRMHAVKRFLRSGANSQIRDHHNRTAIDVAIDTLPSMSIERVISWCTSRDLSTRDSQGNTYLHRAVKKQRYAATSHLLQSNKIDVNAVNLDGCTALHDLIALGEEAMRLGGMDIFDRFIACGFNVHVCDDLGNTLLHWAIQKTNLLALSSLLGYFSDSDMLRENGEGKTPIDCVFETQEIFNQSSWSTFINQSTSNAYFLQAAINQMSSKSPEVILNYRDKEQGRSCLHSAIVHKQFQVILDLLYLADCEGSAIADSEDINGHPPLYYLTTIAAGNECDGGDAHRKVVQGGIVVERAVSALILRTTHLSRMFRGGNTYLHLAAMHHFPLAVTSLLKALPQYSPFVQNEDMYTAMDLFLSRNDSLQGKVAIDSFVSSLIINSEVMSFGPNQQSMSGATLVESLWWTNNSDAIVSLNAFINRNCHIHLAMANKSLLLKFYVKKVNFPSFFLNFLASEEFTRWYTSDAVRAIFDIEYIFSSRRQMHSLSIQQQVFRNPDLQAYILEFL